MATERIRIFDRESRQNLQDRSTLPQRSLVIPAYVFLSRSEANELEFVTFGKTATARIPELNLESDDIEPGRVTTLRLDPNLPVGIHTLEVTIDREKLPAEGNSSPKIIIEP